MLGIRPEKDGVGGGGSQCCGEYCIIGNGLEE